MFRSPQPGVVRREKTVKVDQDKVDLMKYLGTTLESVSSQRHDSALSRRSASVPNLL